MSGKEMAGKLRDLGFTHIKSHMTALDEFEELQVEGVLGAHGYKRSEAEVGSLESELGSGLIRRKKKKKGAIEAGSEAPPEAGTTPEGAEPEVPTTEPSPEAGEPTVDATPSIESEAPEAGPLAEPDAIEAEPAPAEPVAEETAAVEPEPAVEEPAVEEASVAAAPPEEEAPQNELAPGVSRDDFSAACEGRHSFSNDISTIEV